MLTSINKTDLILIAVQRGHDKAAIKHKSKPDIVEILAELTAEEVTGQAARDERRKPLARLKLAELKAMALARGLPCSGDKTELIDSMCDTTASAAVVLDQDQQAVIAKWNNERLIISAGPGAGKTTVLCNLVSEIIKNAPNARILMLAFNKEAQRVLTTRVISTAGTRKLLAPKSVARAVIPPGSVGIRTFNEFAYGVLVYPFETYNNNDSYDAELTKATAILSNLESDDSEFEWDWVIVDEGQDVQIKHAALIDAITARSTHIIVAGDPRQEIYPGAVWFSQICASGCEILRYNHRSHPKIVKFINDFSRRAFPGLHIEQIAGRASSAPTSAEHVFTQPLQIMRHAPVSRDNAAESADMITSVIADFLYEAGVHSRDAYAIAPVTVHKSFNAEIIVRSLRQSLFERARWPVKVCTDDGANKTSSVDVCCIGTSRFLKGTERKAVAVFMTDIPYENYGITSITMKKLLFVAMSRAVDHLMINICENKALPHSSYLTLLESCAAFDISEAPKELRMHRKRMINISVTDLAKKIRPEDINLRVLSSIVFTPLEIRGDTSAIICDADFRGNYVEAAIAKELGADLIAPFRDDIIITSTVEHNKHAADGCIIKGGKAMRLIPRELLPLINSVTDLTDKAFFSAKANYSITINREWTVSDNIEGGIVSDEAAAVVEAANILTTTPYVYQHPIFTSLYFERQIDELSDAGCVIGVIDLTNGADIIEVKHAAESTAYAVQLAIYGTMVRNSPAHLKLLNTAVGRIDTIAPIDAKFVNGAARAILAIKAGNTCGAMRIKCKAFERASTIIVVDIEHDGNMIIEIGAVAVSSGDFDYVSHFHGYAPECCAGAPDDKPAFGKEFISSLIGINLSEVICEAIAKYAPKLLLNFNAWVASFGHPDSVIFVQWSGSDATRLRWAGKSFDLRSLFKTMLESQGVKRAEVTNLSDAVAMVLGPNFSFQAHRALEDAIATTAILVAIVDRDGSI